MPKTNELKKELEYFETHRDEFLRKHKGQYLLIHDANLEGHFNTLEDAITEGVRKFGAGPFLARRAGENAPKLSNPALSLGVKLVANPPLSE